MVRRRWSGSQIATACAAPRTRRPRRPNLASFADANDTRCAKLSEQLEQAKGLAGQPRHEAGDHRDTPD
jgi:hypothetical protein